MSFVGPRPEVPRYVDFYPDEIRDLVLSVRPGITCPSSLQYIRESQVLANVPDPEGYYINNILPVKLRLFGLCPLDVFCQRPEMYCSTFFSLFCNAISFPYTPTSGIIFYIPI